MGGAALPRGPVSPPGRPILGERGERGETSATPLGSARSESDAEAEGGKGRDEGASVAAIDASDPLARALFSDGARWLAFDRVSSGTTPPQAPRGSDAVDVASRVSLEHVMSRFVRRIAWSGDAHSGSARLELGAGALAGATLTIHSEGGSVRVSLELPPGVDRIEWRDRIAKRLGARGVQVASLDVE